MGRVGEGVERSFWQGARDECTSATGTGGRELATEERGGGVGRTRAVSAVEHILWIKMLRSGRPVTVVRLS